MKFNHQSAQQLKEAVTMETNTVKRSHEQIDSFDRIQFKFLFLIVFSWFFVASLGKFLTCLLYTSPSPRDVEESRMPSSA